jgi:hypothetical protein
MKTESYAVESGASLTSVLNTTVLDHSKEKPMSKYATTVELVGHDGNAFAIMAKVSRALKDAGASKEDVDQYMSESMSGDYDNLLRVATQWVEVA